MTITPNGVLVKVPYTVTGSTVNLPAFTSTSFTIATAHTQDNDAGIIAVFKWSPQSLAVGTGQFNAYITIDDSTSTINDNIYNAKQLDIDDDTSGFVAASFLFPINDNSLNLGTMELKVIPGIQDRNFNVQTNGQYEHKFLYLPVINPNTGKTWLNNNLGAEYADSNNPNGKFNPLKQATTSYDPLACGSLFQWGRQADGHELIDRATGTGKYNDTTTNADDPSDSLFITETSSPYDWRVSRDDTLWASESSTNNVCPVGYRLPLNNDFFVESQTWVSQDSAGALGSKLTLPMAGLRSNSGGVVRSRGHAGYYWSGSLLPRGNARLMFFYSGGVSNISYGRAYGFSVRCLK